MKYLLDLLYLIAVVFISPVLFYRMVRHNRYRRGWTQKFGKISRKDKTKKSIWIHAVSVGEVNAAKTIIEELKNKYKNFEIVISTTTDTGFSCAMGLFASDHAVFYFPLDFSWVIQRAFKNIDPAICLLMELEVWPNFVDTAKNLNVPIVVINGRISDKSFSRYKAVKPLVANIFTKLDLILAQTEEYAGRFRHIGAKTENVVVTGSLKYDTAQTNANIEGSEALAQRLGLENKDLWVCGGTGNDEEAILLEVYRKLLQRNLFPNLRLVIVPRKPERFNEVAQTIKQSGFACIRYSHAKLSASRPVTDNQTVILGDTMGDLRKFYSLAKLIFVGRSIVPMGGSDMMEAAALGKCTIFGPFTFNFRQTVDALIKGGGAIRIENKEQLLNALQKCLLEPEYAAKIAENGQEVIIQNQGATQKTIEQIAKFLTGT